MVEFNEKTHNLSVPRELKEEFFNKFQELCADYGVHIYNGKVEFPVYLKSEDSPDMIPAIFFEFYDGDTYSWSDGTIEYGNCNSFENVENNDVITVNGVSFNEKN